MAKRFTSTEIWDEDWFLDMPNEYKLFWYYMLAACDHAGLFRVNASKFNRSTHSGIKIEEALELFNAGKQRIREISKSVWLIEEFFFFQYGEKFNINNPMHKSILGKYKLHSINILEVRGLKDHNLTSKSPLLEVNETTKVKDKDILIDNINKVKVLEINKGFNTTPNLEDVADLHQSKVKTAIERVKMHGNFSINEETVLKMWEMFKIQFITGANYYANIGKVESHFIEWIKMQKFNPQSGNNTQKKMVL